MTSSMCIKGAAICISMLGATPASAAAILIVNGSSNTSEPSTTASITTQLSSLHTAVGNTVTVVDTIPVQLTGFAQVWDLRFSNSSALSSDSIAQYVGYLQGGGGMFVMGENAGFATRNNSILSLVEAAGGGTLSFAVPGDTQTVYSPFTSGGLSSVTFSAAGGVDGFGSGQWISSNDPGTAGSGVAWGVGTLTNAPAGALTVMFDVNFLQTNANPSNQALARNLVQFVGSEVGAVPEPGTWAMMLLGFGAIGFSMRRRRTLAVAKAA